MNQNVVVLDKLFPKLCQLESEQECIESRGYALNDERQVIALNLSQYQLSQIPAEIFRLEKLEYLVLSHNKLTSLTSDHPYWTLKKLPRLKYLDLSFNEIKALEDEIFSTFAALEYLDLSHNPFTALPLNVLTLPLKFLHLNDNFANELSELKHLCQNVKQDLTIFLGENQFDNLSLTISQENQCSETISYQSSAAELAHSNATATIVENHRSETYQLLAAKVDHVEAKLDSIIALLDKLANQGKTWADVLKFEPNFFGVGVDVITMVELLRNKKGHGGLSRTLN